MQKVHANLGRAFYRRRQGQSIAHAETGQAPVEPARLRMVGGGQHHVAEAEVVRHELDAIDERGEGGTRSGAAVEYLEDIAGSILAAHERVHPAGGAFPRRTRGKRLAK